VSRQLFNTATSSGHEQEFIAAPSGAVLRPAGRSGKIAILLIVGDVQGGGGVERFYLKYLAQCDEEAKKSLFILTTSESRRNILKVYPDFPMNSLRAFPVLKNRMSRPLAKLWCYFILLRNSVWCVHVANFDSYFGFLYRFLSRHATLTLNIIDCRFAPEFENDRYSQVRHSISSGVFSGVFSWYRNVKEAIARLRPGLYFQPVRSIFTDTERFTPQTKEKQVIFAARLSAQKRADHYLQAVSVLTRLYPEQCRGWRFLLWGDGEQWEEVRDKISALGLEDWIQTGQSDDMSPIFNKTSIFVSTQMYENFTSLSMLEAMASGNAIVAYNVGQTGDFVTHGRNGLLVDEEDPALLAEALFALIKDPARLRECQEESVKFVRENQTFARFSSEFSQFFRNVAA
jgi:glycosyltransferase involved in cell wall biosynthesis